MDTLTAQANRELIRYAVMREIFCPATGSVLDMRRAVLFTASSGASVVMCAAAWDERSPAFLAGLGAKMASGQLPADLTWEILDGREYWTPAGRARAASTIKG